MLTPSNDQSAQPAQPSNGQTAQPSNEHSDQAFRLMYDNGPWKHPNGGQCSQSDIEFNRDGTGKLNAIGELGLGWLLEMTTQSKFVPTSPRPAADILQNECFGHLKHTNILTKRPTFLGSARLHIQMSPIQGQRVVAAFAVGICMLAKSVRNRRGGGQFYSRAGLSA